MSYFCLSSTHFIVFIWRPVTTNLDRFFAFFFFFFFAVAVSGSWILKLSGTSLVHDPSKKGNRTETGPDLKALFTVDNNPFVNFKFTCQINVDSCTHDFTLCSHHS